MDRIAARGSSALAPALGLALLLGLSSLGCATRGRVADLERRVDALESRVEQVSTTAERAVSSAEAAQAAAQRAADRADDAARTSEAIFRKGVSK
jgi:outer membrane murein-binding lipoprotein Lpp